MLLEFRTETKKPKNKFNFVVDCETTKEGYIKVKELTAKTLGISIFTLETYGYKVTAYGNKNRQELTEHYKNVNPFVTPTAGIDSGAFGKLNEILFNDEMDTTSGAIIAKLNQPDNKIYITDDNGDKHIIETECKSGGAELFTIYADGSIHGKLLTAKYVQYVDILNPDIDYEKQVIIVDTKTFLQTAERIKAIRYKKSTAHLKAIKAGTAKDYNDKIAIRDNYKTQLFFELCDIGYSITEFKKMMNR